MVNKRGYIYAGGAGLLLLSVVILAHLFFNRGDNLEIRHQFSDTIPVKKNIEYRMESVNKVSYLVIDAHNVELSFVDSVAPSMSDTDIVLTVAAAFTGERLNYYKPFNICGNYVVNGVAKKGFSSKYNTGYCASYGDTLIIESSSKIMECGEKSIQYNKERAVSCGGSFFQQLILVDNGEPAPYIPFNKLNLYRALCLKENGEISVVQSLDKVNCKNFATALIDMGYKTALYLDMGNWAWGWLREDGGSIYELSYKYPDTQYQTNWLVLRKVRGER